ncbi:hypothetical protein GGP46_002970 [Salinibacter ruber]|nr:hypothetical protein [Salinibacter ruber]MCS4198099.1 hypothetical protein [Salinibacter ruber]
MSIGSHRVAGIVFAMRAARPVDGRTAGENEIPDSFLQARFQEVRRAPMVYLLDPVRIIEAERRLDDGCEMDDRINIAERRPLYGRIEHVSLYKLVVATDRKIHQCLRTPAL